MTLALRYRRVSGLGQEDNSSLEKQLDRIDEHCAAHNYLSPPEYLFTEVMTAVETWRERPELQKLLALAEQLTKEGQTVVVVVDHPDRFARGLDLVLLVELIEYYGASVEFAQIKFEDTDEGKLVLHLQSYSSKQEWKRIKKRTHDGIVDRVTKKHKLLGSTPPFGYTWDDPIAKNKYVYNDEIFWTDATGTKWSERSVVVYIFQKAKEGATLRSIARSLTELGIPTKRRIGIWDTGRISALLSNPKYMGKCYSFNHVHYRQGDKWKKKAKPLAERVLMPDGTCPAIVDEETWYVIQQQLEYNQRTATRNTRFPEKALCRDGIAFCGHCGGRMGFRAHTQEQMFRYICRRGSSARHNCPVMGVVNIVTHIVDEAVWKRACQIIRDPNQLKIKIEALRTPDPTEKPRIPLAIQKKETEDDIENLIELGKTTRSEKGLKKIQFDIALAEEKLAEIIEQENILLAIQNDWEKVQTEIARFEMWCKLWVDKLDKADYKDKRTCVEYLGIRVHIFQYGHRPRFTIGFVPPDIMNKLSSIGKLPDENQEFMIGQF